MYYTISCYTIVYYTTLCYIILYCFLYWFITLYHIISYFDYNIYIHITIYYFQLIHEFQGSNWFSEKAASSLTPKNLVLFDLPLGQSRCTPGIQAALVSKTWFLQWMPGIISWVWLRCWDFPKGGPFVSWIWVSWNDGKVVTRRLWGKRLDTKGLSQTASPKDRNEDFSLQDSLLYGIILKVKKKTQHSQCMCMFNWFVSATSDLCLQEIQYHVSTWST